MVVDLNVFRSFVDLVVVGDVNGRHVVGKEDVRDFGFEEFCESCGKPDVLLCCHGKCHVFSFCC